MKININSDAVVEHTNRLEQMHRSALPVAIRGSLNSAAFDVKLKTMPIQVGKEFVQRNKTFFKANSRVEMAKGFDVSSMVAVVGFTDNKLKGGNNFAVKDLAQQERGGKIKGKSFIPTDEARGGNKNKPVRPSNRLGRITNIVNSENVAGRSPKEKFKRAVMMAGKGGFVLGNIPGKKKLYKVLGTGKKVKTQAIYSYDEGRSVDVDSTNFMQIASMMSGRKIEQFFIKEAKRQFKRLKK